MNKRKRTDKYNNYLERLFPTLDDYFKPWDLDRIIRDQEEWRLKDTFLTLYVCAKGNNSNACTTVDIGCTEVLGKRLAERNSKNTHRSELLLAIILPPYRNFTGDYMKSEAKAARGWKLKCERALKETLKLRLTFKICAKIVDPTSPLYTPRIQELLREHISEEDLYRHFLLETSDVQVE